MGWISRSLGICCAESVSAPTTSGAAAGGCCGQLREAGPPVSALKQRNGIQHHQGTFVANRKLSRQDDLKKSQESSKKRLKEYLLGPGT